MKKSEKYNMLSWITLGFAAGFIVVALIVSFTYSTVDDNVLRLVIYGLICGITSSQYDKKKLVAELQETIDDLKDKWNIK